MSIARAAQPDNARKLAADLERVGVKLPTEVTKSLAALDTVEGMRPEPVTREDITAAYLAADAAEADRLALLIGGHDLVRSAWDEARIKAGGRVLATFTANGDNLTRALARKAGPLIDEVVKAAALDTRDLSALIRDGRTKDAEVAARLDVTAADLAGLYALRSKVTKGAEYGAGGYDCSMWRDPRPVLMANAGAAAATTAAAAYLRGLRAGGQLWFPTPGESASAASALSSREKSKAAEQAAEDWRTATGAKPRKLSA